MLAKPRGRAPGIGRAGECVADDQDDGEHLDPDDDQSEWAEGIPSGRRRASHRFGPRGSTVSRIALLMVAHCLTDSADQFIPEIAQFAPKSFHIWKQRGRRDPSQLELFLNLRDRGASDWYLYQAHSAPR